METEILDNSLPAYDVTNDRLLLSRLKVVNWKTGEVKNYSPSQEESGEENSDFITS